MVGLQMQLISQLEMEGSDKYIETKNICSIHHYLFTMSKYTKCFRGNAEDVIISFSHIKERNQDFGS